MEKVKIKSKKVSEIFKKIAPTNPKTTTIQFKIALWFAGIITECDKNSWTLSDYFIEAKMPDWLVRNLCADIMGVNWDWDFIDYEERKYLKQAQSFLTVYRSAGGILIKA